MMLKSESFSTYTTDLGEEAIDLGRLYDYDLITLALNLPDMSGYDVIKQLRVAKCKTPMLVCSGLAGIEDIVKALGVGADDYMTKPFHKDELVARIHAIVRRTKGHAQSALQIGALTINLDNKSVSAAGSPIHLTGKEYAMLELLALRAGSLVTKEMFLNHLYGGMDEPEIKIIDVFICKLRKKLPPFNGEAGESVIQTVWGRGYTLAGEEGGSEEGAGAVEVRDFVKDPPTGFVTERTFNDHREEDRAAGRIKSPSLVPAGAHEGGK
jgi:two-component system cell cycle response regulator CtrA